MQSVTLVHNNRAITAAIENGALNVYLLKTKWLTQPLSPGFSCARFRLVEKQTKRVKKTIVSSYALCALGHAYGVQGLIQVFVILTGNGAPVVYFSNFIQTTDHKNIGGKRKNQSTDGEPDAMRTKYDDFKDNELSDYMQDVEVEMPDLEDADDDIAIPDDNWSNILAFLSSEEISRNTSSVNVNTFEHSVDILDSRKEMDPIILFAMHGNKTSLVEMLRRTETVNPDIFTYALRESIERGKPECTLALLRDGRCDPTYSFIDTDFVGELDRVIRDRDENKGPPRNEVEENIMKIASSHLEKCLGDPEHDINEDTVYVLTADLDGYNRDKCRSILENRESARFCNALLHIQTSWGVSSRELDPIIRYLLDNYKWTDNMAKFAMIPHYKRMSIDMFNMISSKYNIHPDISILRHITAWSNADLSFLVFKKLKKIGTDELSLISGASIKSDGVMQHLMETDMAQVDPSAIGEYTRVLFETCCYYKHDRVDILRYFKEKGNIKLRFHFPESYHMRDAPDSVVRYLIEEYRKDVSHSDFASIMRWGNVYVYYALKYNIPRITGKLGVDALRLRVERKEEYTSKEDAEMVTKLLDFAIEHKCMDTWFEKILKQSDNSGSSSKPYDLVSVILGESRYDPVRVAVEFIRNMKMEIEADNQAPVFEYYRYGLIPLFSDRRILAALSDDEQLKQKTIIMLKTIFEVEPVPKTWPQKVQPVPQQDYSETLIEVLEH